MATETTIAERLMEPVGQCLTTEVARRLAELRADDDLQRRVDELAEKANHGTPTAEERDEYQEYVSFWHFITHLQTKARSLLDATLGG